MRTPGVKGAHTPHRGFWGDGLPDEPEGGGQPDVVPFLGTPGWRNPKSSRDVGDDGHFRGTCGGALDPRSTRMGVLRGHAEGVCLKKRTNQIEKTIIYLWAKSYQWTKTAWAEERCVYSILCEFWFNQIIKPNQYNNFKRIRKEKKIRQNFVEIYVWFVCAMMTPLPP